MNVRYLIDQYGDLYLDLDGLIAKVRPEAKDLIINQNSESLIIVEVEGDFLTPDTVWPAR